MEITNYELLKRIYIEKRTRDRLAEELGIEIKSLKKAERRLICWLVANYGEKVNEIESVSERF